MLTTVGFLIHITDTVSNVIDSSEEDKENQKPKMKKKEKIKKV